MQKLIVTQRQEAGSKNGRENARQKRKLVAGGLGLIALATLMGLAVHGPLRAWGQGGGLASGRQTEVPAPPHAELAGRTKARVQTAWGKLPLYFTENRGQVDGRVAYYVQGQTTSLYFDTPQLDVYYQTPSFKRRKYRVRRYGDGPGLFVECKRKWGDRVAKERTPIAADEVALLAHPLSLATWPAHWFHRSLLERSLLPACHIAYHRTAYAGDLLLGKLAQIGHAFLLAHFAQH